MGKLVYLNTEARLLHATQDRTLRLYCELEATDMLSQAVDPDEIQALYDMTDDMLKDRLARTYGLTSHQALLIMREQMRAAHQAQETMEA